MEIIKPQSIGGRVTAIKLRKEALEKYYINPNKCLCCNKIIEVPEGIKVPQIRKKKFCNQSCAAKYNNQIRIENNNFGFRKKENKKCICFKCNKEFYIEKKYILKYCNECIGIIKKEKSLFTKTKGELFKKNINWQSARSNIQKSARDVYRYSEQPKQCIHCGYNKHYEVCHRKPVSDFSGDTLIAIFIL